MADSVLNAQRDRVLALVGEQQQIIVRLAALPELAQDHAGTGLNAGTMDRFRSALGTCIHRLKESPPDPGDLRACLAGVLEQLQQQGEVLRPALLRRQTELDDQRQRLERASSEGQESLARLHAAYVNAQEAAHERLRLCTPAYLGLHVDALAALRAVATAYLKTGIVSRDFWDSELQRRAALGRKDPNLPESIARVVAMVPKPIASPPSPPAFDPTDPALPCPDGAAAKERALSLLAPLVALAQEGARWTDHRAAHANAALARAITAAILERAGGVLGGSDCALETRTPASPPAPTVSGLSDAAAAAVSQRIALRQSRQERDGSLARLGRWWRGAESAWGYEVRTSPETKFAVAMDRLAAAIFKAIDEAEDAATALPATDVFQAPIQEVLQSLKARLAERHALLRPNLDSTTQQRDALDRVRRSTTEIIKALDATLRHVEARRAEIDAPAAEPSDDLSDVTMVGDATMIGSLMAGAMMNRLELTYREHKATLAGVGGHLTLGRGPDNSLVIAGPRASRHHAEISFRDGSYTLTDTSTNGTIILGDRQEPVMINRSSGVLRGNGRIGLGVDPSQDAAHAILFRCISSLDSS